LIKFIVTGVLFLFLQACATAQKPQPKADPVALYKKAVEAGTKSMVEELKRNLKEKNAYGYVEPYYPLRLPPDIRKVWIVDHPNESGDLIQGHWVFIVLSPERWASPSIPSFHSNNGEKTSHAVPVIEDKPVPQTQAQGKVNAAQSQ